MAAVTARACANIALVKYWGKRDAALNLPAAGSLSLTLAGLVTETTVRFDRDAPADQLELDGAPASAADLARTTEFLDLVRARAGITTRAHVISANHFPTASGLGIVGVEAHAALALAASGAAGLALSARELSVLARRGSGSAARCSLFGGFVRGCTWDARPRRSRMRSPSRCACRPGFVDRVRMVIAIVGGGAPKSHGSRDAMAHTAATSPLYPAWLTLVPHDLAAAEAAIAAGDLAALGALAEANALAMHASALAARPAVIYFQPTTLALLAAVRAQRAAGRAAWATMDAGPHVKVLTTADDADAVARALADVDRAVSVSISAVGGPATVVH